MTSVQDLQGLCGYFTNSKKIPFWPFITDVATGAVSVFLLPDSLLNLARRPAMLLELGTTYFTSHWTYLRAKAVESLV